MRCNFSTYFNHSFRIHTLIKTKTPGVTFLGKLVSIVFSLFHLKYNSESILYKCTHNIFDLSYSFLIQFNLIKLIPASCAVANHASRIWITCTTQFVCLKFAVHVILSTVIWILAVPFAGIGL